MTNPKRTILIALLVLLIATAVGVIKTSDWFGAPAPPPGGTTQSATTASLVDQTPLLTAQKVAALASTSDEQTFAQEALRDADQEVDLALAAALQNAIEHPPAPTPETRDILARINESQTRIQDEQNRVNQLTKSVASANGSRKDKLQQQLELVQAQLELDQDELASEKEDLLRAGGDRQTLIQKMLDEHEAASHQSNGAPAPAPAAPASSSLGSNPYSLIAEFREWNALRSEQNQLQAAKQETIVKTAALGKEHDALQAEVKTIKTKQPAPAPQATANALKPSASAAQPAANAKAPAPAPQSVANAPKPSANATQPAAGAAAPASDALATLHQLAVNQKAMAGLDKQVEAEKDLGAVYDKWIELVQTRKRAALHSVLLSVVWIFVIANIVVGADIYIDRYFANLPAERKRMRTLRTVIEFGVHFTGFLLVLLVVFGPPSQLATVLALAGAGLTVALKDFIVGFLGWFVLMGKNGIRVGDWVEINGVGGEVIEIGLLHTVLLETGNWADAGHPTGRRVSFVNSYAIEGHYFNFSTTGQWLWDELEVFIPLNEDPNPIAQEIQKLVATETQANARLAEQEWQRVAAGDGLRAFSAAPAVTVRPTSAGIEVVSRYITRANERHEVRARLYQGVVALLQHRKTPEPVVAAVAVESELPDTSAEKK